MALTRREFVAGGVALLAAGGALAAEDSAPRDLRRQVGVTMSSLARQTGGAGPGKTSMLDWPRILRDELDLRVIDLNSSVLESLEPGYLERVRRAADDAGCVLTNMKVNRSDVDIGHADIEVRRRAVAEMKRWIDASALLGLRWARPLPLKSPPDMPAYVASYRELADYAAQRRVQMLVENYGWMESDAESVPRLLEAIGRDVAPCPDTGNWSSDEVRYAGLARMFPRAVTCDFKARELDPDGGHAAWDLRRCFAIGWEAGFRGPWCLEHAHPDRRSLFRELALLRDMLRGWMAERG